MSRISGEAVEACVAFASASQVATEARQAACDSRSIVALELLAELEAAHDRLRRLFAAGADEDVCCLALSILVLADRLAEVSW